MTALQRRQAELDALEQEGVQVMRLSRWHCRVGSVHLYLAAGRWMNELSNAHGRINHIPLRQLISEMRLGTGMPKPALLQKHVG